MWKTPATRSVFSASDKPSSKPKCVVLPVEFEVLLLGVAGLWEFNDVLNALAYWVEEHEQGNEDRSALEADRKTGLAAMTNKR